MWITTHFFYTNKPKLRPPHKTLHFPSQVITSMDIPNADESNWSHFIESMNTTPLHYTSPALNRYVWSQAKILMIIRVTPDLPWTTTSEVEQKILMIIRVASDLPWTATSKVEQKSWWSLGLRQTCPEPLRPKSSDVQHIDRVAFFLSLTFFLYFFFFFLALHRRPFFSPFAFAFPLLAFEALPSAPLRDPPQGGPQRGAQVPPSKGRMRSFGVRPYREAKTWEASQSTAVLKAGFIDEVRRIDLIRPSVCHRACKSTAKLSKLRPSASLRARP